MPQSGWWSGMAIAQQLLAIRSGEIMTIAKPLLPDDFWELIEPLQPKWVPNSQGGQPPRRRRPTPTASRCPLALSPSRSWRGGSNARGGNPTPFRSTWPWDRAGVGIAGRALRGASAGLRQLLPVRADEPAVLDVGSRRRDPRRAGRGMVAEDGESKWLEGAMLLMVHTILGVAFFSLPDHTARAKGHESAGVNARMASPRASFYTIIEGSFCSHACPKGSEKGEQFLAGSLVIGVMVEESQGDLLRPNLNCRDDLTQLADARTTASRPARCVQPRISSASIEIASMPQHSRTHTTSQC